MEGFIYVISPFNFTAIAANLFAAPILMGNVAVWKPSPQQVYSAWTIVEIFNKLACQYGVLNMVLTDPIETSNIILNHKEFAGLHFTGSTFVFQELWKQIGNNINNYKSYPKIVGETGGKDFIFAHKSADIEVLSTALVRGAFEFQGQKCSACCVHIFQKVCGKQLKKKL